MTSEFKGGNSRLLAKALDSSEDPLAILDRRGQIIFVNVALCRLANSAATGLVGKHCLWELAADSETHGDLLNALAPPAAARHGQLLVRGLSRAPFTPEVVDQIKIPSEIDAASRQARRLTGQLFIPILDEDRLVHMTIVLFAELEKLNSQFPDASTSRRAEQELYEQTIANVRSRWSALDEFASLLGDSPAIELAMKRTQMATRQPCNVLISGPQLIGKRHIAQGIFRRRSKLAKASLTSGQCFPIDVSLVDDLALGDMLDAFAGRLRSAPLGIQQLVLERLDCISEGGLVKLLNFTEARGQAFTVVGLSELGSDMLTARGPAWSSLISQLADIEIQLPPIRERRQDIPVLVQQFLAAYCRKMDRALLKFSPRAMNLLTGYSWPRNLHELRCAVESSVEQAMLTNVIDLQHLPVEIRTFPGSIHSAVSSSIKPISLDGLLEEFERTVILRALKLSPRNRAQVARWLGITRSRLLRRISQLGLETGHESQPNDPQPNASDLL